jgi:hypothetical protein
MITETADTAAPAPATPNVETPQSSTEMSAEQSAAFWETGQLPKSSGPAPDKKTQPTKQDSAPAKENADTRSDSASDKEQKSTRKDKEDSDRRWKELSEEKGRLARENEELRQKVSASSEKKPAPASQPAPEPYKRLDEKKFFTDNPKATYEDFVDAAAEHKAKWLLQQEIPKAIAAERQRLAVESAAQTLQGKLSEAGERYGKEEAAKIVPAVDKIYSDPQVPHVIKAMLDRSDVLVDLVYAIGKENVDAFIALSKSDPGVALEKLVELQSDVRKALKAGKPSADPAKPSPDDPPEKKPTSETKAPPPKVPSEVGGRGTATEAPDKQAARDGNFTAFEAAQWGKHKRA